MLLLILNTYLYVFLFIMFGAIFILSAGLYLIFRKKETPINVIHDRKNDIVTLHRKPSAVAISSQDFNAISGDDVLATQLDLARAYIETGRISLAKKILLHVSEQGKVAQQREAENLLFQLNKCSDK